jgi:hypothetical protein
MQTTVVSRGADGATDGGLDGQWAAIAGAEFRPSERDSSGPVPLDVAPDWRWLASRRVRRGAVAILLLELALLIGFVVVYRPFDLNIYLWGGRAVEHGQRLYLVQADANWFTYPPFAATLFTPTTASRA